MKEFHRDFANRTGLAQAWTVKSADRLFTFLRKSLYEPPIIRGKRCQVLISIVDLHAAECRFSSGF